MTLKKSIIIHPRLGRIIVTRNPRARNIIMRARPDAIHATIPVHATEADLEKALTQCGDNSGGKEREAHKRGILD